MPSEPNIRDISPTPSVWGIVLAAGQSTRMGRQKLALPLQDGQPMVRHVLQTVAQSVVDRVLVVVNPEDEEACQATSPPTSPVLGDVSTGSWVVAKDAEGPEGAINAITASENSPVNPGTWRQVFNPDAKSGMSTSLQTGVRAAQTGGATAVVILLGDQPGITTAHINAVVESYRSRQTSIVQADFDGQPSHPILFDDLLFTELLQVTGDEGGRSVIRAHAAERRFVSFPGDMPFDLDTPAAYQAWLHRDAP